MNIHKFNIKPKTTPSKMRGNISSSKNRFDDLEHL